MGSNSLPSPPAEDNKSGILQKSNSSTKSVKSAYRVSKRSSSNAATIHHRDHVNHAAAAAGMEGRHKRVWKACERCRTKKTKCDGEFPCKRCKDDGLICTAGIRKKVEFKQLPRGYAEVLENTQFALIATVHKLYSMVRDSKPWGLDEPELNSRGQPVIHDIAQKLGCIRPNSDIDLPVQSAFPEDEAGLAELAHQLEEQQKEYEPLKDIKDNDSSTCNRTERASSSEMDHSDFERDYRKTAFGNASTVTLSPQSFAGSSDTELVPPPAMFPSQSPSMTNFSTWPMIKPQPSDLTIQLLPQQQPQQQEQQSCLISNMGLLNPSLIESSFDTIKPHILSCSNPEVMMGMCDPMIYSGYDGFDGGSMQL